MIDLDNDDLDRLDHLLDGTPAPLEPMDAVMIDGYLAGLSTLNHLVPIESWLPGVFDLQGRALPESFASTTVPLVRPLLERRYEVMNTGIVEDAWFDPVIVDVERLPPVSEYEQASGEAERALGPWLEGFRLARTRFAAASEPDEEEASWVARVMGAAQARTFDQGLRQLVESVARLSAVTEAARFRVDPVRRTAPKVGRNDPCPCGSGRKYKQCHARTDAA
jgi:uncharacterized protein